MSRVALCTGEEQHEEDQETLWIEGYGELEPPGKDLEGDMEIRYFLVDITTIMSYSTNSPMWAKWTLRWS